MTDDRLTAQLAQNWHNVCHRVAEAARVASRHPEEIRILAVSKTQPANVVVAAVCAGITVFGENYAQELRDKSRIAKELLTEEPENRSISGTIHQMQASVATPDFSMKTAATPPEVQWHFIGRLQRNKCKYVAPVCNMIHSVDSAGLAREISKEAAKAGRVVAVLLQVNTSGEASKSGCRPAALAALAESVMPLPNIRLAGLMTIAGLDSDPSATRREFALLNNLRETLGRATGIAASRLELSMGMSGDFPDAIAEGATIVRIGSLIFGARP